tara:strand:- start:87 stop:431 length:345 start_codon:yes stop_codon:yes gene_type:complete
MMLIAQVSNFRAGTTAKLGDGVYINLDALGFLPAAAENVMCIETGDEMGGATGGGSSSPFSGGGATTGSRGMKFVQVGSDNEGNSFRAIQTGGSASQMTLIGIYDRDFGLSLTS